ncbi:MAG: VCBS repeat-containing protein [Deltaproteobacteria bacterium]|nr:VCBS repeat-containing protein [Deltaproteobacteria bacterium]
MDLVRATMVGLVVASACGGTGGGDGSGDGSGGSSSASTHGDDSSAGGSCVEGCPAGSDCVDGTCVPWCDCADPCNCGCAVAADDCPSIECSVDGDCGEGQVCLDGLCNPAPPDCASRPQPGPAEPLALGEGDGVVTALAFVEIDAGAPQLLVARGDAVLAASDTTVTPLLTAGPVQRFAAADLDGDGVAELAVAGIAPAPTLQVFRRDADGTTWTAFHEDALGGHAIDVLVFGDHDGDGMIDLLVQTEAGISSLPGLGGGGLADAVALGAAQAQGRMAAGDFDGDGSVDLAYPVAMGYGIIVGGAGGEAGLEGVGAASPSVGMFADDFDGDGVVDLLDVRADANLRLWDPAFGSRGNADDFDLTDVVHVGVARIDSNERADVFAIASDGSLATRFGWDVRPELERVPLACDEVDASLTPPSVVAVGRDADGVLWLATSDGSTVERRRW